MNPLSSQRNLMLLRFLIYLLPFDSQVKAYAPYVGLELAAAAMTLPLFTVLPSLVHLISA